MLFPEARVLCTSSYIRQGVCGLWVTETKCFPESHQSLTPRIIMVIIKPSDFFS